MELSPTKKQSEKIVDQMYQGSGTFKDDLKALIRTRIPVMAVQAIEEKRFLSYMSHYARVEDIKLYVWDIILGLIDVGSGDKVEIPEAYGQCCASGQEGILAYLYDKYESMQNEHMIRYKESGYKADVYILLDFTDSLKDQRVIRRLKNLSHVCSIMTSIVVGSNIKKNIDLELSKIIPVLHAPTPGEEEYKSVIQDIAQSAVKVLPDMCDEAKTHEDEIIRSVRGKTIFEAQTFLAKNMVTYRHFLENYKDD